MKGTIVRRGSRYSVVIELDRDPVSGRRRREWHSGYPTKRAAESARVEILSRLQRGEHVAPSQIALGDYLEHRWLPAKAATIAASTHASYSANVRRHIVPELGTARLQGLGADTLTSFYADRLARGGRNGKPLSARSVRYLHAIILAALSDGVRWGLVVRNVADAADPPSHTAAKAPPPPSWSTAELRHFLNR